MKTTNGQVLAAFMVLGFYGSLGSSGAFAVPTNLATSGTATASSVYAGDIPTYGPAHTNNGDRTGSDIWHSANDNVNPAWWEIDLGADYYLDRVQIAPRDFSQGLVENFTLEVRDSSNAVVFSHPYLPATSTDDGGPSFWATNALRNTLGRTVRISRNDANPDAMTFAELEVFGQGTPISLQNLALGRPVTSTAPGFGSAATDGNDGNLDGSFGHGSVYHSDTSLLPWLGHFWQVELDALSEIDYVTLYARGDYNDPANDVRLSLLAADGITTVEFIDVNLGATDLGAFRFDFTHDFVGDPQAKFVRIESTTTAFPLMLTEVEVFGNQIPEPLSILLTLSGIICAGFYPIRRRMR
jgi:hypothetical protein